MITLIVALFLTGCSSDGEDTITGAAAAGAEVFAANCTGCHGADGTGDTAAGFPDLTASDLDAAEIEEYVRKGDGAMPGYEGTLDDQEIADVVAYVDSL